MTHLAQTLPVAVLFVAALTDLTEAVTEEAIKLGGINKNQTAHNPSVSLGEPIKLHRNRFSVYYQETVCDVMVFRM